MKIEGMFRFLYFDGDYFKSIFYIAHYLDPAFVPALSCLVRSAILKIDISKMMAFLVCVTGPSLAGSYSRLITTNLGHP